MVSCLLLAQGCSFLFFVDLSLVGVLLHFPVSDHLVLAVLCCGCIVVCLFLHAMTSDGHCCHFVTSLLEMSLFLLLMLWLLSLFKSLVCILSCLPMMYTVVALIEVLFKESTPCMVFGQVWRSCGFVPSFEGSANLAARPC